MEITNESLDSFREDYMKAVSILEEKYDVTIELGRITYGDERFSAKMTVKNGHDPEAIKRADFDADVWRYEHLGLGPGMYNRIFIGYDGEKYAIQGFRTKAHKHPLIMFRLKDETMRVGSENFITELLDEYYTPCQVIE